MGSEPAPVSMPRRLAVGLSLSLFVGLAALLAGQDVPAPTPSPRPEKPAARKGSAKPAPKAPLNFSGVWELDPKASTGVVKAMEQAAIKIEQNGNRIWIGPLGSASTGKLLADQIVVDGQLYEKKLGKDKGTVLAKWGNDNQSLWIEAVNSTPQDPRAAVQRMVWRLQDFGNTWTRQSWTISGENVKQTFLVFRKRPADWVPTPVYFPRTPTPSEGAPVP
jgi:hypothetical protein